MMAQCWLCDKEATVVPVGRLNERQSIDCGRCGKYGLDASGLNAIQDPRGGVRRARHLVSGHLREGELRPGWRPPVLTEDALNAIVDAAPADVAEQIDRLLLNIAVRAPAPGESAALGMERDYPLGYCRNRQE